MDTNNSAETKKPEQPNPGFDKAGEKVQDFAARLEEGAREFSKEAEEGMRCAYDEACKGLKYLDQMAREAADNLTKASKEAFEHTAEVRAQVEKSAKEQPWVTLGVAAGTAFVLGLLSAGSRRRED